jgi:hypothetical protein
MDKALLKQIKKGIEVEMEHTDDPKMALKIAMDHIKEDPKYYDKLTKAGLEECCTRGIQLHETANRLLISEGLNYHLQNKIDLNESIYRPQSTNFLALFEEARNLYDQGKLQLSEQDETYFSETDLGLTGIYNGVKVPLDFPMTIDFLMEVKKKANKNTHNIILTFDDEKRINRVKTTPTFQKMLAPNQMNNLKVGDNRLVVNNVVLNGLERMASTGLYAIKKDINEADKKKKQPELNKPKRGGSKKFYVYVRKPGGGIKKVSFGDTSGLSAKINNPEARRSFAARHKCSQAKDKTTPKYWSCRLPRYASLLGLKSNFSGFW